MTRWQMFLLVLAVFGFAEGYLFALLACWMCNGVTP